MGKYNYGDQENKNLCLPNSLGSRLMKVEHESRNTFINDKTVLQQQMTKILLDIPKI